MAQTTLSDTPASSEGGGRGSKRAMPARSETWNNRMAERAGTTGFRD